jgi:hypothetical protein
MVSLPPETAICAGVVSRISVFSFGHTRPILLPDFSGFGPDLAKVELVRWAQVWDNVAAN